jgi:hypothetical protein
LSVRYEFLLQAPPGEVFDETRARAALAARRPFDAASESRWQLTSGPLEVRPLDEAGKRLALELHIELAESDSQIREALREAAEAARESQLVLYDPQLNRPVGLSDEDAVASQYLRNARYAGEFGAVPGLAGMGVQPEIPGLKPGARLMLWVLAVIFVLLLLSEIVARLARYLR